ncbi:MAG: hypothetical protein AAGA50_24545 [Pseudomonadota bacterium]
MYESRFLVDLVRLAGRAVGVVVLSALATQTALAQAGRPDTRQLTCAQAQSLVQQRGTVVMSTGPTTFEKFISDARYCLPQTNQVRPVIAPTKDNPKCPVGNRCYQNRRIR